MQSLDSDRKYYSSFLIHVITIGRYDDLCADVSRLQIRSELELVNDGQVVHA